MPKSCQNCLSPDEVLTKNRNRLKDFMCFTSSGRCVCILNFLHISLMEMNSAELPGIQLKSYILGGFDCLIA